MRSSHRIEMAGVRIDVASYPGGLRSNHSVVVPCCPKMCYAYHLRVRRGHRITGLPCLPLRLRKQTLVYPMVVGS